MSRTASFEVRVEGSGRPMVLVPGAACDETVWTSTVARFRERYTLHMLSLAGFAGRPRISGPLLSTARAELGAYLARRQLDGVVVVGHSLGSHLAYGVGIDCPDQVAAVISIDGVPALGQLLVPGGSAQQIEREAARRRDRQAALSSSGFRQFLTATFGAMVAERSRAEPLIERGARSEPSAVAEAMYELWTADLRAALGAMRAPVLLVAPGWPAMKPAARAQRLRRYREQLAAVTDHEVVVVEGAHHFVMLDAPAALFRVMERFLAQRVDGARPLAAPEPIDS